MANLCPASELYFFLPMARGFRREDKVDEGQDSDSCHLWVFAFPVGLSRLVYNPVSCC